MVKRLNALIAVGLVLGIGAACSLLRPKHSLTWHLTLEIDSTAPDRAGAVRQTISVIEKRLNAYGVGNFEVKPENNPANGRIIINLPEVRDPERLKKVITTVGKLELVHVISPPSPAPVQTYTTKEEAIAGLKSSQPAPTNPRVLPYIERSESSKGNRSATKWVVVQSPIIDGRDLTNASPMRAYDDIYDVRFTLNKAGADKFGEWTNANINEYVGVVLNDEVTSIAYIKSQINDQGEITGNFTKQTAEDLALVLKAGALPAAVRLVDESGKK